VDGGNLPGSSLAVSQQSRSFGKNLKIFSGNDLRKKIDLIETRLLQKNLAGVMLRFFYKFHVGNADTCHLSIRV